MIKAKDPRLTRIDIRVEGFITPPLVGTLQTAPYVKHLLNTIPTKEEAPLEDEVLHTEKENSSKDEEYCRHLILYPLINFGP